AKPYGFRFTCRGRDAEDLDSRVIKTSNFYWLGGKIETMEELEERNDPSERILRSNMKTNGWDKVIVNTNSYRWTQPLGQDDVILDVSI
ncbi:MAG: hypothetical protein ACR2RE_07865, partial [Geminicoccaceae bacterium]